MHLVKKVNTEESFEKEYNELMQNYTAPQYLSTEPQWKSPSDFFVKFSLYPQQSSSLTSTNTSLPQSVK